MSDPTSPRVCICVSGQLRGAEEALPALRRATAHLNADVIFSVWDTPGRKLEGAIHYHQLERLFAGHVRLAIPSRWLTAPRMWEALPDAKAMLAAEAGPGGAEATEALIHRHFPEAVVDVEPVDLLHLAFDEPRDDLNAKKMLYKLWRAEEIRRRRARDHGPYDLVFRMRPDLVLHDPLDLDAALSDPGAVFVDRWSEDQTGDLYAFGAPAGIDAYAALFARAITRPVVWDYIHKDLTRQLHGAGFSIREHRLDAHLAQGRLLTAADLLGVLEQQRARGVTSPTHEATAVAVGAVQDLERGDVDAAAARLETLDVASLPLDACESWLALVAVVASRREDHLTALAALALVERASVFHETFLVRWAMFQADDAQGLSMFWSAPGAPITATAAVSHLAVQLGSTLEAEAQRARDRLPLDEVLGPALPHLVLAGRPLAPDDVGVGVSPRFDTADLLKRAGRYAEAEAWQRSALALLPDHAGANRQMAEILSLQGRRSEALPFAARAHALEPQPFHAELLAQL